MPIDPLGFEGGTATLAKPDPLGFESASSPSPKHDPLGFESSSKPDPLGFESKAPSPAPNVPPVTAQPTAPAPSTEMATLEGAASAEPAAIPQPVATPTPAAPPPIDFQKTANDIGNAMQSSGAPTPVIPHLDTGLAGVVSSAGAAVTTPGIPEEPNHAAKGIVAAGREAVLGGRELLARTPSPVEPGIGPAGPRMAAAQPITAARRAAGEEKTREFAQIENPLGRTLAEQAIPTGAMMASNLLPAPVGQVGVGDIAAGETYGRNFDELKRRGMSDEEAHSRAMKAAGIAFTGTSLAAATPMGRTRGIDATLHAAGTGIEFDLPQQLADYYATGKPFDSGKVRDSALAAVLFHHIIDGLKQVGANITPEVEAKARAAQTPADVQAVVAEAKKNTPPALPEPVPQQQYNAQDLADALPKGKPETLTPRVPGEAEAPLAPPVEPTPPPAEAPSHNAPPVVEPPAQPGPPAGAPEPAARIETEKPGVTRIPQRAASDVLREQVGEQTRRVVAASGEMAKRQVVADMPEDVARGVLAQIEAAPGDDPLARKLIEQRWGPSAKPLTDAALESATQAGSAEPKPPQPDEKVVSKAEMDALLAPPDEEPAMRGAGPAAIDSPEFTKPGPADEPTSIKNAVAEEERARRGLPAAQEEPVRHRSDVHEAALAEHQANPTKADSLIAEVNDKPSPLSEHEQAMVAVRTAELENEYDTLNDRIIKRHEEVGDNPANPSDRAEMIADRLRWSALSDQILEARNAGKHIGTETARALGARGLEFNRNDFSIARLVAEKRAANNGRQLTSAEHEELTNLRNKLAETQKQLDEHTGKADEQGAKQRTGEAVDRIVKEETKAANRDRVQGKVRDPAAEKEAILNGLRKRVADGDDRSALGPLIQRLARHFVSQGVRERDPLVDAVHGVIKDIIPNITPRETMDAISGYGDFKQLSKDEVSVKLRDLKGQMQQVAKLKDMTEKGQAPLKTGVERRVPSDEERRLQQQVNETKKKLNIQTTDPATQLKSALDSVKTRLKNQISDLEQQIATGEKIVKTKTPGPRDAEAKAMETRRDELKKQYDDIFGRPQMSDAQRVRLAIAAAEKSIAEYDRRIKTGDLFPGKPASKTPNTPELLAVRARRDALRNELDELQSIARPGKGAEQIKQEALQKRIDDLKQRIAAGDLAAKSGQKATVDTEAVMKLRQEHDALTDQLSEMRKAAQPNPGSEGAKERALQRAIDNLEARIKAGDISTKGQRATVDTANVMRMRARRDQLGEQLDAMRKAANPPLTPDQIALKSFMTRTTNRIAELQDKIARDDFAITPRRELKLDPKAMALKAQLERYKQTFDRGLLRDKLKNRTLREKTLDALGSWRVSVAALTWPTVFPKLLGYSASRWIGQPIKEGIGYGFSKVLPGLAERAPREGSPSFGGLVKAEVRAISEGSASLRRQVWKKLATGKSDLDVINDKRIGNLDPNVLSYIVNSHGAIKTPTQYNEYARSEQRRLDAAVRSGKDITDPLVRIPIESAAYQDSQRAILQQKNLVNSVVQFAHRLANVPDKATGHSTVGGQAGSLALKGILPITKVPVNFVKEVGDHVFGIIPGGGGAARAYWNGIENIKPDQADAIMRHLKNGSVGPALMLAGWIGYKSLGGLRTPHKENQSNELKPGEMKIGKHVIGKSWIHTIPTYLMQIGATLHYIADDRIRGGETKTQALGEGSVAAGIGLLDETPYIGDNAITKIGETKHPTGEIGRQLGGMVTPGMAQFAAGKMDTDAQGNPVKRKPQSFVQGLETNIPGLRKKVPEVESPAPRAPSMPRPQSARHR